LQNRLQTLGSLVPVLANAWLPPDRLSSHPELSRPICLLTAFSFHSPPSASLPSTSHRSLRPTLVDEQGTSSVSPGTRLPPIRLQSCLFEHGGVILGFPRDLMEYILFATLPVPSHSLTTSEFPPQFLGFPPQILPHFQGLPC
jgi:hypothetical protein